MCCCPSCARLCCFVDGISNCIRFAIIVISNKDRQVQTTKGAYTVVEKVKENERNENKGGKGAPPFLN